MRTVRQLIYRDVFWSVFFVAVAFLSLFFFIDFVDEMGDAGRHGLRGWDRLCRRQRGLQKEELPAERTARLQTRRA